MENAYRGKLLNLKVVAQVPVIISHKKVRLDRADCFVIFVVCLSH
jgi:hypothetical protein